MLRRQPKKKALSPLLSLDKLTSRSNELGQLMIKAEQLNAIDVYFEQALPSHLKGNFVVNSLGSTAITITATSAALATRCRMSQKQILTTLNRQRSLSLTQIKIKIRPKPLAKKTVRNLRTLSKENAQILEAEAEQTKDEKLKAILARLASHARQD